MTRNFWRLHLLLGVFITTVLGVNYATLHRAAREVGVSYHTIRNHVVSKDFQVFKLPGRREHCVDLDEVRAYFEGRPRYSAFGPDVDIIDLSNHAAEYEVAD